MSITTITRRGKRIKHIDFVYGRSDGTKGRYNRDAKWSNAEAEEKARLQQVGKTDSPILPGEVGFGAVPRGGGKACITLDEWHVIYANLYTPRPQGQDSPGVAGIRYTPAAWEVKDRLYRIHIQPIFGQRRLDDVAEDAGAVREFASSFISRGKNPRAACNELRALIVRAMEHGKLVLDNTPRIIREWPHKMIPRQPKISASKLWTPEDFVKMHAAVRERPRLGWALLALEPLATYQGIRNSEIRGLKWSDVDFEKNTINIHCQLWGRKEERACKAGSKGVIALYEEAKVLLLAARDQRLAELKRASVVSMRGGTAEERLANERIIRNSAGTSPTRQQLLSGVYRLADAAGVPRRSVHAGRHTGITAVLEQTNCATAMKQARHSQLRTTERYEHVDSEIAQRTRTTVKFGK
jgi:integrase